MTLKEFIEKNPSAVEEAAKCKNLDEFKKLTEEAGITFDSQEKLKKAFDLVKNQNTTQLSDDALDAVSGGAVYEHNLSDMAFNSSGAALTLNSGKKRK